MPWGFVAGAAIGAIGSGIAGGEQAGAQEHAADTQKQMFDTITQQEQPFLQGGYGAESALLNGLGLSSGQGGYSGGGSQIPLSQLINLGGGAFGLGGGGATIPGGSSGGAPQTAGLPNGYFTQTFNPTQQQLEQYPGYQFQRDQGNLALQNANSVGGSALSGAALKSLMSFNQGLAASNYNTYFNQFQEQQNNIFNRLSSIASLGQNAAANLGNSGTTLGTGIAQAQAAAGGSIAGGIAGASNNIGNAVALASLANGSSNPYVTPQGTISGGGGSTLDAGGGYTFSY